MPARVNHTRAPGAQLPRIEGVDVEHVWLAARGMSFHVALAGPREAQPLLLLHGWPQHWYEWRKVLPELAASRRCVVPDLRGLGWSEAPPHGYRKETLAQDVLAILDELQIESADLIGHDWGGWIGFLIALREPQRLRRFLALNIIPPWPPWQRRRPSGRQALNLLRLWYQVVLATPRLGEALLVRTRAVELLLRADNVHRDAFADADLAAFSEVLREPERARASSLLYRDFLLHEMPGIVRGRYASVPLTVPTHLLFGLRDGALGGGLASAPPQRPGDPFTLELVEDSGHFIAEERPELVLARAHDFLGV